MGIAISVHHQDGAERAVYQGDSYISAVYQESYQPGDFLCITNEEPGFYQIRLEDTMPEILVYLDQQQHTFLIPYGEKKTCYHPRAFDGERHALRIRKAYEWEIGQYRNLAFNPYDCDSMTGAYPHASANVHTRGEAVFEPRNAIDGFYANDSHGNFPYQSWGINMDLKAAWTLKFGIPVRIDRLIITLRADFPHDSYWTQGTVSFSDGSEEIVYFEKTAEPQIFEIEARTVTSLVFRQLIQADDPSPFPALTQFEAWGIPVI